MASDQKRTLLAIVLSGIVLFTWQMFFAPKQKVEKTTTPTAKVGTTNADSSPVVTPSKAEVVTPQAAPTGPKQLYTLKTKEGTFTFSDRLTVEDATDSRAVYPFHEITDEKSPLVLEIYRNENPVALPINLTLNSSENILTGTNDELGINFRAELLEDGRVLLSLNSKEKYRYRVVFKSKPKQIEGRVIRQYMLFNKDMDYFEVGDENSTDGSLKWAAIDFHYHLFAFVFDHKQVTRVRSTESGNLYIDVVEPTNKLDAKILFTKKNYDDLAKLGDNLQMSVDFGVFGVIAVPILRGLQFFYKYIANYGLAIIVLTLLIRMLTFPLQYKSFKSMKKMQKVQPELQKLKEKFKDDPQRMQKETMELFKRAGANPLGGCFPLLLQMPIFFAFYQVLYNAVELVGAPFYFWINDLSAKDPYYVLPVFMAVAMLVQSKLNPSASADPTQKKIMYVMPLVFGFIMKDLPSGLNLYMTVSILFGALQQIFVYKTTD